MSRAGIAMARDLPGSKHRRNIGVTTVASTVFLQPGDTNVFVVPPSEAVAITIVLPAPEEVEPGVVYSIWSDGNDSGTIEVDFGPSETGDITAGADALTADQDYVQMYVRGNHWVSLVEVST